MLKIIAAVAENRVIGSNGELPWHLPDDMKWFKEMTGKLPVVMGRKTFDSLPPSFKPLPGRKNIVLTRDRWNAISDHEDVVFIHDFSEVVEIAKEQDVFVIGGADIYKMALPYTDEMYLTRVHAIAAGNVIFPLWNPDDWSNVFVERHEADANHPYPFTWEVYCRKQPAR